MVPGKRYAVFAIRTAKNGQTIWVRAGVAFVQPDDSMNMQLDVLPLDGVLHIRESQPKHVQHHNNNNNNSHTTQNQSTAPSMGGH